MNFLAYSQTGSNVVFPDMPSLSPDGRLVELEGDLIKRLTLESQPDVDGPVLLLRLSLEVHNAPVFFRFALHDRLVGIY